MTMTSEIPAGEWREFLPRLSQRNQGRPVRLETSVAPGEGEPVLAEHQPFLGLELEPRGSEAPAITVMLGGLDARTPEFTHFVRDPTRLWVEENLPGSVSAVEIESAGAGRTLLVFEREAALPEPGRLPD